MFAQPDRRDLSGVGRNGEREQEGGGGDGEWGLHRVVMDRAAFPCCA